MGATCAVCLQPIVTRNDVRVSGTEVMHRACAATGQETIGWRNKRELADLRAQLAQAQGGVARQRDTLARVRAANRELERLLTEANCDRDLAQASQAQAADAMAELLQERDAALAELAKRPPAQPSTVAPEEDQRDATEQRFSLLELD